MRILKRLALLFLVVALGVGGWVASVAEERPTVAPSPEADALARRVEVATGKADWDQLGALRWRHAGRNEHLWDRARGFARVKMPDGTAWIDLKRQTGRAEADGQPLAGADGDAMVAAGLRWFNNDMFWLAPYLKFFDEGVTRAVLPDGRLYVAFASGGDTPGDSYAFRLDDAGVPVEMQMWVGVLPIPGLRSSWESWSTISGSARLSFLRKLGPLPIPVDNVVCAGTLAEVEPGPDPFAALAGV